MLKYMSEQMKNLRLINPMIEYLEENEYRERIQIFKKMKMVDEEIEQIFCINPLVLTMSNDEIYKICLKLKEVGIKSIAEVIYMNPQILNMIPTNIDEYIEKKIRESGENIVEVIKRFEENPNDINEM